MQPGFCKILQIGFVVADLDKTVKTFADKYGIGPWAFYEQEDILQNCSSYGKPCQVKIKAACAFLDQLELELIQPLDEESLYGKFLQEHGEGLHHLAFDTEDAEQTMAFFKEAQIPMALSGVFGGQEQVFYADTRADIACLAEFYKRPDDVTYPMPTKVYPE